MASPVVDAVPRDACYTIAKLALVVAEPVEVPMLFSASPQVGGLPGLGGLFTTTSADATGPAARMAAGGSRRSP